MEKEILDLIRLQGEKIVALEQLIMKHHPEWKEDYQQLSKALFSKFLQSDHAPSPMVADLLKQYLGSVSDE